MVLLPVTPELFTFANSHHSNANRIIRNACIELINLAMRNRRQRKLVFLPKWLTGHFIGSQQRVVVHIQSLVGLIG